MPARKDNWAVTESTARLHERFKQVIFENYDKVVAAVRSVIYYPDSEDVIADVMLAIWTSLPVFSGQSKYSTFLYSIVKKKIADFRRRQYREKNLIKSVESDLAEKIRPDLKPSEDMTRKLISLTRTETLILKMLSANKAKRDIAKELFLSVDTIKSHVRHIYKKLGVKSRGDAAFIYIEIWRKILETSHDGIRRPGL